VSAVLFLALVSPAWADHPGLAVTSTSWSPLTSALVFGGLALLAGMIVVIIVALLTKRSSGPE
jgi:predicted branched-subunit amino acid permease